MGGKTCRLADFPAQAYLLVNTASRCGFTPQYEGLETLWQRYKAKGLVVLAFPCDQFGHQEPAGNDEIEQFCKARFSVSFSVSQKIEVNGVNAHPLFDALKRSAPGVLGTRRIKWNFTKFLVSGDGAQVKRFAPLEKPASLHGQIEQFLSL
ncbi:glutathione peroxidase [Pseudomonas asuensis]|jgi:glutathione peroxidase|uniref:Glutathione peroxidase n=2 Tax=Pseudomonas asuensis TaxID=1825787 RepID=A0ABQ2H3R4_9PSED|nr:glutathione peroxidase [Pseudomonas asuensis]